MKAEVSILDYGVGNILSVQKSIAHFGYSSQLVSDAQNIARSNRLILPGVGAFSSAMESLRARELIDPILEYSKRGNPLLGICLGMQMLLNQSEEFGLHDGLTLIEGTVVQIPTQNHENLTHKIPHIGWNEIYKPSYKMEWNNSLLKGTTEEEAFYFVHSFMSITKKKEDTLAICNFNGIEVPAVIAKENVIGCQFHPEKSGKSGLQLIKNFCES